VVRDSNLRCREGGDTPLNQASVFPISTFQVYDGRPTPSLRS
jgi:hypothetical protein